MADEPILETAAPTVDPTPDRVETKSVRTANPTVQLGGIVLAVIIAFGALVWAQGIRLNAVRRESFGRGIDGVAAALAIPVIETKSVRLENRTARLQSVVEAIKLAGQYDLMVVTDANGNVLASTDTSLQGQTLKEMATVKTPTTEKDVDGFVEAVCAINAEGGNKVGALRIRTKL